jgi:hypothetical protein
MKKILPIIILLLAGNFLSSLSLAENHDQYFYGFSDICSVPEIEFEYAVVLKSFQTSEKSNITSLMSQDNCHFQFRDMSPVHSCQAVVRLKENRQKFIPGNNYLPDSFNGQFRCDRAPPKELSTV